MYLNVESLGEYLLNDGSPTLFGASFIADDYSFYDRAVDYTDLDESFVRIVEQTFNGDEPYAENFNGVGIPIRSMAEISVGLQQSVDNMVNVTFSDKPKEYIGIGNMFFKLEGNRLNLIVKIGKMSIGVDYPYMYNFCKTVVDFLQKVLDKEYNPTIIFMVDELVNDIS